jgi:Uma2 family endonuclease
MLGLADGKHMLVLYAMEHRALYSGEKRPDKHKEYGMSWPIFSFSEPITEPDILESIKALPTENDLPCEDGEPMETPRHRDQMHMLIESLKMHWADRRGYYVGGNMFVHYDPTSKRRSRGPDFFLVLDVEERERKSWVVWQEGMRFPDVIIELLSDSTREIDKGGKKELYERLFRTAEYYLYDPFSQEFSGYHLRSGFYEDIEPDAEGKIYSKITQLYVGVREGWLRWITPAGEVVPTPLECVERERQRAERAEQLLEAYRQRFGVLE